MTFEKRILWALRWLWFEPVLWFGRLIDLFSRKE